MLEGLKISVLQGEEGSGSGFGFISGSDINEESYLITKLGPLILIILL
jgi:hypothetical protein